MKYEISRIELPIHTRTRQTSGHPESDAGLARHGVAHVGRAEHGDREDCGVPDPEAAEGSLHPGRPGAALRNLS